MRHSGGTIPTQALIKKHIASIQMKRIWLNRNGTNNTAKWTYMNTSRAYDRSMDLTTKVSNEVGGVGHQFTKLNQKDVSQLIEQYTNNVQSL